jgi:hypothetical protein
MCEFTPSRTNPVRSIILPLALVTMSVMGETDATTFSFLIVDVIMSLVLLVFA